MMQLLNELRFERSFVIFSALLLEEPATQVLGLANQVFIIDTVSGQCEQEELVCFSIFVSVYNIEDRV